LHPISGIKTKLEGYQLFLKSYPPYRQNTCLIQYVLPESFSETYGTGEHSTVDIENKVRDTKIEAGSFDPEFGRSNHLNWT
jgi:trehalose-6-phosphate synthase